MAGLRIEGLSDEYVQKHLTKFVEILWGRIRTPRKKKKSSMIAGTFDEEHDWYVRRRFAAMTTRAHVVKGFTIDIDGRSKTH